MTTCQKVVGRSETGSVIKNYGPTLQPREVSNMTKDEFKTRWESNDNGDGITFEDIANCAIDWGISRSPRTSPMNRVRYNVLKAASVNDAEEFNPTFL